jgi:DnaJ-class molecular chaperone
MTGSFFERLDLHWICTTSEVEAAYQKLAAEFAPSSVARFGDASRPTIQYISDCLKEAYDVLKTDASRREYRLKVIEKGKIEQSAEMLSKKGEMAVMKALAQEALECYVKANELVPHVAEYREGLQRARMMPRG